MSKQSIDPITDELEDYLSKNSPEIKPTPQTAPSMPSPPKSAIATSPVNADPRPRVPITRGKNRRELPASISLSRKMLPPITRRKTAIYQLLDLNIKIDPRIISGPNKIEPQPYQMVPVYSIYDPFEPDLAKRNKVMVYSEHVQINEYMNPISKTMELGTINKMGLPEFTHGQVMVDCEAQYLQYTWWELHPDNASNKYRDKRKRPVFKRVDIERQSPHLELIRRDMSIQAERYVIDMNKEKLINLGAAFGFPPSDDLRLVLRRLAYSKPEEVMFKSPDSNMSTSINVMKGLDHGILDYTPERGEFFFPDEDEPFFIVPAGQEPMKACADFLCTEDGAQDKKDLEDFLNFWE